MSSAGEGVGGADAGRTGMSCMDSPKVFGSCGLKDRPPGVGPFPRFMKEPNKSAKLGVERPKLAPAEPGRAMSLPDGVEECILNCC